MIHSGLNSADRLWISYFCALLPIAAVIWVVVDSVTGFLIRVLVDAQPLQLVLSGYVVLVAFFEGCPLPLQLMAR